MKKNIKRSVFSVALCAMLVFCISFYSSVEPTTAWFSDTGDQTGSFNMDEIEIIFAGDGITGESGNQTANTIELNFKAATKSADEENDGKPEPMFEYAAEFYTFTAENKSDGVTAKLRAEVICDNEQVKYCVYELTEENNVTADGVSLYLEGVNKDYSFDDIYVKPFTYENVTTQERVVKAGDKYYDASLVENLDNKEDLLLSPEDGKKTYCIAVWVEYTEFDTPNNVDTISCNATLSISAEQYVQA